MNNLIKKGIIAVSANTLATTVKLGVENYGNFKGILTLKTATTFGLEFAKSFVTSTLPALAVDATPNFFANKYVNFGFDAVISAVSAGALGFAECNFAPDFLKSDNFSDMNKASPDIGVNFVNTFVQAEAFNYFTQDDSSSELDLVDLEFGA